MINEEKSLIAMCKFLLWLFTALIISFIGLSGVFALEYNNIGYVHTLSGVNGEVTIDVTYETESGAPLVISRNQVVYTQLKALNVFISNYSFESNRQYQIEMEFPYQQLQYANTYQVFDQNTNELCSLNYSESIFNSQWPRWNWACPHATNSIYIKVYNSNNTAITSYGEWSWNYMYMRYTNSSISSDVQDTDIIINNNNMNTDRIINNNNQNTQDIINNNDENTQKIIEENKKNFQDCGFNLLDGINYIQGNILNNGTFNYDTGRVLSDYFKIKHLTYNYQINDNLIFYIISYDYQKNFISRTLINNTSGTFTPTSNTEYLRISFRNSENTAITPDDVKTSSPLFYSKDDCINKLDEQKNAINNVDNTLKDDNVDENGVADAFEGFNDFLDDNSTITQLITLPITLYTAILNNLNGTCSPFNLGKLYGEDLILPCINISQYLGNSLWTMIDIIISGFAVYAISKKMIKVFNNFSSLREGDVIDD